MEVGWKENSAENTRPEESYVDDISEIGITIKDYFPNSAESPRPGNHVKETSLYDLTSDKCSIYRVPGNMREVDKNAYDPKLVSIGPFHYKDSRFEGMEKHKWRFLSRLMSSFCLENVTIESLMKLDKLDDRIDSLELLGVIMRESEAEARACYSEKFDKIESSEFVWMMVFDGCFIVELLLLYAKCAKECVDHDPIFETRWMLPVLQLDLLMLENQLPLFVLQEIFEMTKIKEASLTDLTLNFFDPLMPSKKKMPEEKCKVEDHLHENDHLLELFHSSFLSSFKDKMCKGQVDPGTVTASNFCAFLKKYIICRFSSSESTSQTENTNPLIIDRFIFCATELQERGVVFKKRVNHDLLDIEFERGVLKIPPLRIDDRTGPIFLNFVAYEQCNSAAKPYFTDYVIFFDNLVNSSKDVEILHYSEIINHGLGNDEDVADLFNKLCKEVFYDVDNCYLSGQLKDINRYSGTKWNKWRAKLMHDYFSSPWTFCSFLAAILLLVLTIAQTVFSILSYVHPTS